MNVATMVDSDSSGEKDDASQITPQMLISVIRGEATDREREIVTQALKDPKSPAHDWLEGVASWAQKTFGGTSSHVQEADEGISEVLVKRQREDIVAFIHQKRSQGKIDDHEIAQILKVGEIPADVDLSQQQYARSVAAMLDRLDLLRPEIAQEIRGLMKSQKPSGPGHL